MRFRPKLAFSGVSDFAKLLAYQKWRCFARGMVEYYPRVRKKSPGLQAEKARRLVGLKLQR
jgi:hypothetical protein